MALSITARPRALSWSLNDIRHTYHYTLPTAGDRLFVQVQDSALNTITEISYPIDASVSSGDISPRIDHLISPKLKWLRPTALTPGVPAQLVAELTTNIASFNVRYRAAPPGFSISWTQDGTPVTVIKGGIGDMTFMAEAYANDAAVTPVMPLPQSAQFLTWVPQRRLQAPDEWGWLLFLSLDSATQRASYYVEYLDGTTASFFRLLNNTGSLDYKYPNWYIPTGVDQAGLDAAGKGVKTVNIQVEKSLGAGSWSAVANYVFNVDNRKVYNPITLYYRNSVGGWDNIRLRGEHERFSEAERREADMPNPYTNGRTLYYDAGMRPKWKANTGFISREHLAALDDLLLSKECALLYDGKWLPVNVTSKSLTPLATRANLVSTVVEFEAAGSFSSFPKQLAGLL